MVVQKSACSIVLELLLILAMPFVSREIIYLALIIEIYRLVKYGNKVFFYDIALLTSFSSIYRLPSGINVISLLCLFGVLILLIQKSIKISYLFLYATAFCVYILFRSYNRIGDFLSVAGGIFLIYCGVETDDHCNTEQVLVSFVKGVVIATIYALVFRTTEQIQIFTRGETNISITSDLVRFKGLFQDSNYYATTVILGIVLILLLCQKKSLNKMWALFGGIILLYAGAITYSRSFYLCMIIIIVLFIYRLIKQGYYLPAFLIIISVVIGAVIIMSGRVTFFEGILQRFNSKDANELSSGRYESWINYIQFIFAKINIVLFGTGFTTKLVGGLGVHNLYLEIIFYLGTVGLLLFVIYFLTLMKKVNLCGIKKYIIINNIPLFMLFILYFFLQGVLSTTLYCEAFVAIICTKWLNQTDALMRSYKSANN